MVLAAAAAAAAAPAGARFLGSARTIGGQRANRDLRQSQGGIPDRYELSIDYRTHHHVIV